MAGGAVENSDAAFREDAVAFKRRATLPPPFRWAAALNARASLVHDAAGGKQRGRAQGVPRGVRAADERRQERAGYVRTDYLDVDIR